MIVNKRVSLEDLVSVTNMASCLRPENSKEELAQEFEQLLQSEDSAVFIAQLHDTAIGFAQCQLRKDYVEGTTSSPVGYLEGIFVDKIYRKQGIARQLVADCQTWAKQKGCMEFASDCEWTNMESYQFHLKLGFIEANKIICFTKKIT